MLGHYCDSQYPVYSMDLLQCNLCNKAFIHNSQVKINGQPTELPYRSDRLDIKREGDRVVLTSTSGLSVISDFRHDYHIVGLSGWYFNKVGGLLGNFDYEAYNDFMLPNGDREKRLRRFLNAWEVASSCRSSMAYVQSRPAKTNKQCSAVFDTSSSSLRPCFLAVSISLTHH